MGLAGLIAAIFLLILAAQGCTGGEPGTKALTLAYTGDFFGFQRPCG